MSEEKKKYGKESLSYKQSGVDIDLASNTLKNIKRYITSTFTEDVLSDLSGFSGLYRLDLKGLEEPVLVSSTDGVGTKMLLAKKTGLYEGIGQDLVGMCVNDIICCGARPLFFLDYLATGKIEPETIEKIITSIALSCKSIGVSLIGGETAEMPGMYSEKDVDIAGFAVGIVDRQKIISGENIEKGDAIIGLGSSGLHSNGYSMVRRIIELNNIDLDKAYIKKDKRPLKEILMQPTRLYPKIVSDVLQEDIGVKGIANITGGGFFDNISRILPPDLDAEIDLKGYKTPELFEFLKDAGSVKTSEMYRVFNMGIGMVIIISNKDVERLHDISCSRDERFIRLGKIVKGQQKVIFRNLRG